MQFEIYNMKIFTTIRSYLNFQVFQIKEHITFFISTKNLKVQTGGDTQQKIPKRYDQSLS